MGMILYLLLGAGFFFLMMRFGCGAHVMGHGDARHVGHDDATPRDGPASVHASSRTEIDPVCGMTVDAGVAKSSAYKGKIYYFCSGEHRDTFEASPSRYADAMRNGVPQPVKEHVHD